MPQRVQRRRAPRPRRRPARTCGAPRGSSAAGPAGAASTTAAAGGPAGSARPSPPGKAAATRTRRSTREAPALPRAFPGHRDHLPARVDAALGGRQQLRGPRAGGDVERDQRPVPVRRQPGEDLVELLVRDAARDPRRHPRPVKAGPLIAVAAPSGCGERAPGRPAGSGPAGTGSRSGRCPPPGGSRRNRAAPSRCAPAPTAHTACPPAGTGRAIPAGGRPACRPPAATGRSHGPRPASPGSRHPGRPARTGTSAAGPSRRSAAWPPNGPPPAGPGRTPSPAPPPPRRGRPAGTAHNGHPSRSASRPPDHQRCQVPPVPHGPRLYGITGLNWDDTARSSVNR